MAPKMAVRLLGTLAISGGLSLVGVGATSTMITTAARATHPAAVKTVKTRVTAAWPITAIAASASGKGYLVAAQDGGIFNFGDAAFDGNTYTDGLTGLSGAHPLAAPIVGMAANPTGTGYWLVAKDGGVFNFGGAKFSGSTYTYGITGLSGAHALAAPIVGMAANPTGAGYWLVAADGGVFDFGGAPFKGSTYTYGITGLSGAHPLSAPIVAIIPTPDGGGYWLVAADGGVFDFGNAKFFGSTYTQGYTGLNGNHPISGRIVGGAAAPNGTGYWLVSSTGTVYNFGSAPNEGDTMTKGYTGLSGNHPLPAPVVSIAADPAGTGYWLAGSDGAVYNFGSAPNEGDVPSLPTPGNTSSGSGGGQATTTTQAPNANTPNVNTSHQNSPPTSALVNPAANIAPSPNYYASCTSAANAGQVANSVACEQSAVAALDNGRADQGLPAMTLPNNFYQLPAIDQLFVLVNEERVSRGLTPVYGLVNSLNALAAQGSTANTDPPISQATFSTGPWALGLYANWAEDFSTAGSMYDWMYNDGWGGAGNTSNLACTSPTSSGCWGHRSNILVPNSTGYTPVMGAASVNESSLGGWAGFESDATILTEVANSQINTVSYSYTWAQAVAAGANPQT
ncbi:hypothetical protein [Ferrimicrobium sp.]|uniref:hypothetical protein n=2 Tax=Ferrimicrobium sp. TaxID=2926050 RepID=UPI002602B796|nr:hypothetical protein [Ferrimicrobium sp.]